RRRSTSPAPRRTRALEQRAFAAVLTRRFRRTWCTCRSGWRRVVFRHAIAVPGAPPRANSGGCLMGLPRTSSGKPSHEMNGSSHRYGAQRWYLASRRSTLLRLVIPAALGITIAGFAIGAGVAYLADGGSGAQRPATPR